MICIKSRAHITHDIEGDSKELYKSKCLRSHPKPGDYV